MARKISIETCEGLIRQAFASGVPEVRALGAGIRLLVQSRYYHKQ